jgi:3',5'-cyclic-AMP phosphodiesterase
MDNIQKSLPLLVAQISDLHLFSDERQDLLGWNTWNSLDIVLQQLMSLDPLPDLILLTGDLSQDETEGAYHKVVQRFIPVGIPTYWLPGNHDDVSMMQKVLNIPPLYVDKAIERGGWKFLLLSTNVPGQVYGVLNTDSLQWLEAELANDVQAQPTLLAMHHHPFGVKSPWLDKSGLQNTAAFLNVIDRYPQVQLVLFGHIHQAFERVRRDVTYLSTPSTCIQFMPKSSSFALDDIHPGFRLLWLYPDGRFDTEIRRVCFHQQLDFAAQGY